MLILSGLAADAPAGNSHIIRSDDGKRALWLGAVDDLWQLGKVIGHGGPWRDTPVTAGQPGDAYLFRGYDRRTLVLSHDAAQPVRVQVEVDFAGDGSWQPYRSFAVAPGEKLTHEFPAAFAAYWVRTMSDTACRASAEFTCQ